MAKRRARPPGNPIRRPLAIAAFTTLALIGVATVLGLDSVMDRAAKPLVLACAVLVIAYTGWTLYLGRIATIGHLGQVYHYGRDTQPVWFWLLALLYLGLAGPTAWYVLMQMVSTPS